MTALDLGRLDGRVVRPGDPDYDAARTGWNELHVHRPAAIVYAGTTADVIAAVTAARRAGLPLRARSGGHSLEGWSSVDGGIVIDVSRLGDVAIDADAGTVALGAGVTQGQAVAALGAAGLAVPTGTEGSVSVIGATLGGGLGLLTRPFGMACDSLLSVEIVVADGRDGARALRVDGDADGELLWALRGAGNGSFGIVTSLTLRARPLASVGMVTAVWEGLDGVAQVFAAWQDSAPFADHRLTSQIEVHRDAVTVVAVLAGGTSAEAIGMLEEVLAVGTPAVSVQDGAWAPVYETLQIPLEEEPAHWKFVSHFVPAPFDADALEIVRSFMAAAPTAGCNYFANAFGGAVTDAAPAGGSAFAHRDALFYAEPGAGWGTRGGVPAAEDPLTPACISWATDFAAALAPHADGAYANVPDAAAADWESAYWGDGVARLRAVKRAYDPDDVFRFPQSIRLTQEHTS